MPRRIDILRTGSLIALDPTTPRVHDLIAPQLTYTTKKFLRGRELFAARKARRSAVVEETYQCYDEDRRGRLTTNYGFLDRIRGTLEKEGYRVRFKDLWPHPNPGVLVPRWERVLDDPDIRLRYGQKKILKITEAYDRARIDCPTGYGKSYAIGLICLLYPKARIDVLADAVAVIRDTVYPYLCGMLPSVGIVGGGKRVKDRRVMCYTFDSMHHAEGDADIVLIDEVHQAAADSVAGQLGKYDNAKMFGFSASHDMRLDNKDIRCEGACGPVRLVIPYQQAADRGIVVPIEVIWTDVKSDVDPCAGLISDTSKRRAGIWAYRKRNRLIAKDARLYDDDVQVLIPVATFEHALYLKKRLPEYSLVYSGESITDLDLAYYHKIGLLPEKFRLLDDRRRDRLRKRFERGDLMKVICTTVWNVGVNMRYLQVLIRADGTGSPQNDVQIPGRTSRTNELGKAVGIVHDYCDQHNSGCRRRAQGRETSYRRMGWKQHFRVKDKAALLRRLLGGER
jgi:superfamily II DNA or RNA helicase